MHALGVGAVQGKCTRGCVCFMCACIRLRFIASVCDAGFEEAFRQEAEADRATVLCMAVPDHRYGEMVPGPAPA